MSRNELLRQKTKRENAFKEFERTHKSPAIIKYGLKNEAGIECGYVEYNPQSDTVQILTPLCNAVVEGAMIKSLRDAINKLLDE